MCVDKMNSSDPTVMEDDAPLVNSSTEVVVIRFDNVYRRNRTITARKDPRRIEDSLLANHATIENNEGSDSEAVLFIHG